VQLRAPTAIASELLPIPVHAIKYAISAHQSVHFGETWRKMPRTDLGDLSEAARQTLCARFAK
jgi:hypothetical protein